MRITRLGLILGCTALAASGASTVASAQTSSSTRILALTVGQSMFWNGAYVTDEHTNRVGAAACAVATCYDYPLQVAGGGTRLRVAIDTPDRSSQFELDLIDPAGVVKATASNPGESEFNLEVFAAQPAAGRWIVRVVPENVHNAAFRLRSKLESTPLKYPHKTQLLPDLSVTPPYEFGFVAPANPLNAFAPDSVNPPLTAAGLAPLSCTADEMIQDHVTRCLRFTTGPRNSGPGIFEIDYNPTAAGLGVQTPGPSFQRIYASDGTSTVRPAGNFQFHPAHGHYHYLDFLQFQLFSVESATHRLTPAGSGKKLGLCPADELFADWHTFNQEPGGAIFTRNCGYSTGAASLGLSVGWGDVYRWQRPGQYVDFSNDGDGYYLLQVVVNAHHQALVVHPDRNIGYAYIHVVGDRVTVIERGQGLSPWDQKRTVFMDQ